MVGWWVVVRLITCIHEAVQVGLFCVASPVGWSGWDVYLSFIFKLIVVSSIPLSRVSQSGKLKAPVLLRFHLVMVSRDAFQGVHAPLDIHGDYIGSR